MIVIDRIEDDIACLEVDGEIIDFPTSALPEGAKEGDVLAFVQVDASQILADANDRIERMQTMSGIKGDTFDI